MKTILIIILVVVASIASGAVYLYQDSSIFGTRGCEIEQCSGLDVTCGDDLNYMCDAAYRVGDYCRIFLNCELVNNKCDLIKDPKFEGCKACVEGCMNNDPVDASNCELECRDKFKP